MTIAERIKGKGREARKYKYPGIPAALDGNTAVIRCERESSDGAGAYPITPSTQMGEYWAEAAAAGHLNISGRPLIFIEPEGEHAAAAVTAGLSMSGLRAANFSSGQGIAYMHESLYAAVGKRLTYVLNIGARAMTKASLNVHAGHDDYHCVDDTGFFQLFAANAQQAADLNVIAHRIAELSLNPGIVAQDGFLTTHLIESLVVPERELIAEYLGRPEDVIATPTAAQRIVFGEQRRRVPELWDVDNPLMSGIVQNQDSYMQSVAAQRPFYFDHIEALAEQAFNEYYELCGRRYARLATHRTDDADYLIVGQGSVVPSAEVVADYLRETRRLKVGVVNLQMFRPFPGDLLGEILRGRKGVVVLERVDQPLAADLPIMREMRAVVSQCIENGRASRRTPHAGLPAYRSLDDVPELYSGSFGLGSRDLQPEGLIAAVENMLPDGARRKHFYLSIDFLHETARTPKQAVHQQRLEEAYPTLRELSLKGSENPDLMPPGSVTVRFHSVGGWGAITTGKNLAMILYELLGYHIKANPKYGSEKKGQPTTYYLSAAPEPIRINCELHYVDTVLSPDPNVLHHTNALAGLRDGGVFVIQSDQGTPERVWAKIPPHYQQQIVDRKIRVFFLDAFRIAREVATDAELQLRMQGIAFQGAFFAASPLLAEKSLTEETLLESIRIQLQHKFGDKGARVVNENLEVVRRGYDELQEIVDKPVGVQTLRMGGGEPVTAEPTLPEMVKRLPRSESAVGDIHRFWEQTGNFYNRGQGNDNLADPFMGLGVMPAASALFRDMSGIRFEHPGWIGENCTACGDCYTICPDTAIPGLVSEIQSVFDTAVARLQKAGREVVHLPRATRLLERKFRALLASAQESDAVAPLLAQGTEETLAEYDAAESDRAKLAEEFDWLREALGDFQFALSRPFFALPEKERPGSGGLLSITVDPYRCKGCMECVAVCDDGALVATTQTDDSEQALKRNWDFWLDLPNTPEHYQGLDDLEEGAGALHRLLLDKRAYLALSSGDGACLGCSEKTVIHLFTATVTALMQGRVSAHLQRVSDLLIRLEEHLRLRLMEAVDVEDSGTISALLSEHEGDLTLSDITERMEQVRGDTPIDTAWLARVNGLIAGLKDLKWRYDHGVSGRGRAAMGMLNATGCTSVWGSTWPYNPYPFPWSNHLFQDSASLAMGVFEGHMVKMAEGFRTIRSAELELAGKYVSAEHDEYFARFGWEQFSDEEFELCPPVVALGGDGAMYDIGFQNLSRMMMSGKPIKVVVVDTQVYSNTGGQACTSGFVGQVSDMAAFGVAAPGKTELRKEIGLIAMAHRTTYVMQGSIAHASHMIEGFIEGLRARRPALFNLYTSCQPEHGIGDDQGYHQAKLAVESRAYPLFRYHPDRGVTPQECFDLDGNPALYDLWPTYELTYVEAGREKSMTLPLTFADFAMTEGRFRKHFRTAPPDTWHDGMRPLAEFLELEEDEREGLLPFIWTIDSKQRLSRLLVDRTMVSSCEERRDFWRMLKAIARAEPEPEAALPDTATVTREVVGNIARGLMRLAGGEGEAGELLSALRAAGNEVPPPAPTAQDAPPQAGTGSAAAPAQEGEYMAPWLDTQECTACDECTAINDRIFAYNSAKKAYIKDPDGGPYRDLVKAAEKCTARVIHPGLPRARDDKDILKWIKRGEKYN